MFSKHQPNKAKDKRSHLVHTKCANQTKYIVTNQKLAWYEPHRKYDIECFPNISQERKRGRSIVTTIHTRCVYSNQTYKQPEVYSGTSLNGHSLLRKPHYTGQNVAVWIEFTLRIILYSSLKCGHLSIL